MKRIVSVAGLGAIGLFTACAAKEHVLGGKDAPSRGEVKEPDGGSSTEASGGASSGSGGASSAETGGRSSGGAVGSGGDLGQGAFGGASADPSCRPTVRQCYSSDALLGAPGAECLARIQNTLRHIQLRRTWLNPTAPAGYTLPIIATSINSFAQLSEPECNTPAGTAKYIQAIDIDLDKGEATTGSVKAVTNTESALTDGLCLVDIGTGVDATNPVGGWHDIASITDEPNYDFALPEAQMSDTTGWPQGLTPPMPQPWKVAPVKAKRLTTDFRLDADRETLLHRLSEGGDLSDYSGVFYYDEVTGVFHQYAPLTFELMYDSPTSLIAVPVREAQMQFRVAVPNHPDCVGHYTPDCMNPNSLTSWSGTIAPEGDSKQTGYALITELEQIYSQQLAATLCVVFPTAAVSIMEGWATDTEKRCRKSAMWNPKAAGNAGLPKGDWCAATNSPATATCHDAFRTSSFDAFQAFKVKSEHCKAY